MNNIIPIVLAADKNYAAQMYITILSAIKNKKTLTFYDFYCLIPEKFAKSVQKEFFKLKTRYNNINIKFVIMGDKFKSIKMQISHITTPTYYRLMIAEILPKYSRAIYLDVDTIVLEDLTEFYNIDLGDNYIGGVHAAKFVKSFENDTEYYKNIGIMDISNYVNAGVLLWNLDLLRKNNMTQKLLEMSKKTYKCMDQDIINAAFYKKIKCFNFRYNFMTCYEKMYLNECQKLYKIYGEKAFKSALKNPAIIHYASDIKPWNNSDVWYHNIWNKYALKSPLKVKKLETTENKFIKQVKENKSKKTIFWGASLFLEELMKTRKIKKHKSIGIIDKDISKHGNSICGLKIYSPQEIELLKPEVIIFAIKHNSIAIYAEVKKYLEKKQIKTKLLTNVFDNNK